ncbi:MAG: ferredoxin [Verrucomicrobia bacterium]|nr:ferredoxin [Verrucomicrobiota bacterium]
MDDSDAANAAAFRKMGLGSAQRHVFLCVGPDCCASTAGLATWEVLKRRLALSGVPVMRTKAACLRICQGGPWLLVYPEGIWYGGVTPERCERIVQEHLVGGRIVQEWVVERYPLPGMISS